MRKVGGGCVCGGGLEGQGRAVGDSTSAVHRRLTTRQQKLAAETQKK